MSRSIQHFVEMRKLFPRPGSQSVLIKKPTIQERRTDMFKLKQILVAVDFSDASRLAVKQAAELADGRAQIDLLHVWELPFLVSPAEVFETAAVPSSITSVVSAYAQRSIDAFAAEARANGINLRSARTIPGPSAYRTIVEEAQTRQYDLLVVGTHSRQGLSRTFLGSVAERIVRHATCPVLVARAQADIVVAPARSAR
jgi:nucleotide-binding universal stress UspA family protein